MRLLAIPATKTLELSTVQRTVDKGVASVLIRHQCHYTIPAPEQQRGSGPHKPLQALSFCHLMLVGSFWGDSLGGGGK